MEDQTTARPADQSAGWWWGTNRPGGTYYAGRTHVVHPAQPATALCGLPVEDVLELRPPVPAHLCPDCCVLAMTASFPAFAPTPAPRLPTRPARTDRSASAAEQTAVMPAMAMATDP